MDMCAQPTIFVDSFAVFQLVFVQNFFFTAHIFPGKKLSNDVRNERVTINDVAGGNTKRIKIFLKNKTRLGWPTMARCTLPSVVVVFFFSLLLLRVALGFSIWCQWSLMLLVVNHCLRSPFFSLSASCAHVNACVAAGGLSPKMPAALFSILCLIVLYIFFFSRDRWELGAPLNRTASKRLEERSEQKKREPENPLQAAWRIFRPNLGRKEELDCAFYEKFL